MTDISERIDLPLLLRGGWIARGISYSGAGILAASLVIAGARRSEEPTQKGAVALIADAPFGKVLLLILAVGLALFAAWELITVATEDRSEVMDWFDHIGKLIGVGFYAFLGFTAVQFVFFGGSGGGSGSMLNDVTSRVMQYPLGRIAISGVGVVLGAIAVRRASRVWSGDFSDSLDNSAMSETHRQTVSTLGRAGEAGRSLSFLLMGGFFVAAGWNNSSSDAKGLDRLLYSLTGSPLGRAAVLVVGVGFLAYGLFCIVSSPARRLPDSALSSSY